MLVKYLISEAGCDPNQVNDTNKNCLLSACKMNCLNIVSYLLESVGCDMNVEDSLERNILHISSFNGYFDLVKLILLHRARI